MGESFDIQNLLQTGYFTTSRAKSPKPYVYYAFTSEQLLTTANSPPSQIEDRPSSQPPAQQQPYQLPYYPLIPRPKSAAPARVPKVRPPPPCVEDEEVSLKREHGASISKIQEEEPSSRGDAEQNPVIMEVHEYNPERRFVILTGSSSGSEGGETDRKSGSDRRSEPERRVDGHRRTDSGKKFEPERKYESESKPPRVERVERPERNERVEQIGRAHV